jgi:hypothetical protein
MVRQGSVDCEARRVDPCGARVDCTYHGASIACSDVAPSMESRVGSAWWQSRSRPPSIESLPPPRGKASADCVRRVDQ